MAKLYFRVASDWQEVVKLRQEIDRLKTALKTMDSSQSPAAFKALNNQLSEATKKMDGMVMEAAKAGAKIEGGFKKKIFDASQVVNGLTEKITLQRGVIRQLRNELSGLKDKYKDALKSDGDVNGLGAKIKSVNARLSEQKAVLFSLTQQQAGARLNVKKLRDEYELYNNDGKEVNDTNEGLALSWEKVIGVLGGATALKAFISEMVNVRGEFQQLEIAFGTMLKSKEKADKLMSELVSIAAKTPFDLQGIASSAKQMLAYGSSVESVGKELVMLGNVAAGVGAQLGDIAYLYGTLRTQGRAYAADIRQFAGRGIPIYEELANVMGRNKDEISDLVSQGKVGFKEVEQAFQNMTKEGGMYFNLMEEQSRSLTGQISNLGDAWDSMLNEIGKKGEGVFYTAISSAKSLVENYEKVGMVIEGLIITYGAYKTALMVNIALEKVQAAQRLASIKGVTAMKIATDLMTGSLSKLNKVLMLNPYALVGAAAITTSVYLLKWADSQDKCTEATERFAKAEEASKKAREDRNKKVDEYIKIASDEKRTTGERRSAIDALKDMYKGLIPQYDKESFLLKNIAEYKKKINEEELRNERIGTKTKLVMLDRDIAKYEAGLKETSRQGAGQAAQAIMNTLNNLKKERVLYERKLQQLESEASGSGAGSKEEKVKNKSYWEKQKKDAQAAIDAIDSISRKKLNAGNYVGVKKEDKNLYIESKKNIKEAEKHLKVYENEENIQKEADKKLKQQDKVNEQLLSLQRKNQQDEVALMDEGREKKLAKINADFEAQKQAIEKQAKELAKTNKEAGVKELNKDGLTEEQQSEIDKASKLNAEIREKAENDVYRAEFEAMRNYLKEYGTFQEQKLAIAEEYAEKIAKAQSHGEKLSLEKQRDSALLNVDIAAAKQNINWQSVFGDLGMILKEQIQPTIDNLKKLTESEEFKNASYEDQNQIYDLISELESQSGELGGSFKQVAQDLELYRNSLNAYNAAYSRQIEAANKLAEAQKKLKLTKENGGDVSSAEREVEEAQQAFNETTESVKALGEKASENANTLQNSSSKVKNSLEGLASNFDKLKSGSLSDAFDGIKGIGKRLGGKIGDAIANIDPTGIIGGVLSIMDVLKDGVSTIFVSLQDTLFGAVNGILSDVLSGDIVVKTWKGIASNVGNLFNTITFGGFNKLFGIGGNGKEVEHAINRLTDRNETLQTAIEDLTDEMKASKGSKSVEAYNEAKRRQEEVNRNYLQIAQEQARYSKSHHSWNYYWRGFGQSQIAEFSKKIGRDWNGDIWNLSPEEMKQLRETVDMWNQIQTTGKGGYGERLTEKLDDYIEQAGKIDELQKDLFEGLTGITFESMYDSYISTLMDMTKSAEDAADDISKYFMQAMLSNVIGEQMYDKLKAWYDKFGEYMKEGGLSEDERNNLLNGNEKEGIIGWNEIIKQGFELRDELAAATGYDKTFSKQQEASRGFGAEMTHEDAGELSGRFTALQIAGEEIKVQSVEQTKNLNILTLKADAILSTNVEMRNIADDARNMIASSYLELVQISENTGAIVKPIHQMQKDIEEVKRNTSRL